MSRQTRLAILGMPVLGVALVMAPAASQAQAPPDVPEYYNACIGEASSRHNVILTADKTIYSCFGAAAQNYFNFLVQKNAAERIDKQRTGTYIFREIAKVGRCWTKIENVDGVETATYGCSINVAGRPK
jgi:hypothetical protein